MVYVIVPLVMRDEEAFRSRLDTLENKGHPIYRGYDRAYFIKFEGTTEEISRAIGFHDGEAAWGIVLRLSAYTGYAHKDLWEWLDIHISRN